MSKVVRASLFHGVQVAYEMRESDRREVWSSNRLSPIEAVEESIIATPEPWALIDDEGAVAVGGVAKHGDSTVGVPWMLATDRLTKHAAVAMRHLFGVLENERRRFALLVNHVHGDNEASLSMCKRLGFYVFPAAPFGALGEMFNRIEMKGARHV